MSLSARIEESFLRQLESFPEDTQRLLLVAAAEPLGDPEPRKAVPQVQLEEADARKGQLSVAWNDLQRSWNEHIAKIREDVDAKRAEHDVDKAKRRAIGAEEDADYAITFALAAIDEAEYAVLQAILAKANVAELSGQPSGVSA